MHRLLVVTIVGALSFVAACAREPEVHSGTYHLHDISGAATPFPLGGSVVLGEGAEIHSATLVLHPDGRFDADVVVTWTDSGTVDLASQATGRWRIGCALLVLEYDSVQVPSGWCPVFACSDTVHVDTGRVVRDTIELRRLIALGPSTLGANRLHLQHSAQ